jgi:hypothetical protein
MPATTGYGYHNGIASIRLKALHSPEQLSAECVDIEAGDMVRPLASAYSRFFLEAQDPTRDARGG